MRKVIGILVAIIMFLLIVCIGVFNMYKEYEIVETFEAILESKKAYIDSHGKAFYLKDYKLYENGPKPTKVEQSFLDFDGDGRRELILKFSCEWEQEFLVLYYNGYDVFGFSFSNRAMLSLKEDGTFMGSSGASSSGYSKVDFEDNNCKIEHLAIRDTYQEIYEIEGKKVSKEQIDEYINEWSLKKNVVWEEIDCSAISANFNDRNEIEGTTEKEAKLKGKIYKEADNIFVYHEDGSFSFVLPQKAIDIQQTDKKITFALENEFSRVEYLYEIADEINSAPEAELKIKEITDRLPYSYEGDKKNVKRILQEGTFPVYYGEEYNFNDVWYDSVSEDGVAYFYRSFEDGRFDEMYAEAYSYRGGVGLHEKIEVNYFDFKNYYETLGTRIEKNDVNARMKECIVCPLKGTSLEDVIKSFEFSLSASSKVY